MAEQKTITQDEALATWLGLNDALRQFSEEECWKLLAAEKEGKRRTNYLLRIFSRANKLRADRERVELIAPPRQN